MVGSVAFASPLRRVALALLAALALTALGLYFTQSGPTAVHRAAAAGDPIYFEFGTPGSTNAITGESTAQGHVGWIELNSFSWGVENPTTIGSATGGAGAGKAKFNELTITKPVDSTSPHFYKAITSGSHADTATVDFVRTSSTGTPQKYLQYKFTVVFTTKISWSSGGDRPSESLTFVFESAKMTTFSFSPTGVQNGSAFWCWNTVQNVSC